MKNVDEIIIRYYKASFDLSNLIAEKAKGDWSKAELLISNDNRAKQIFDEIEDATTVPTLLE